MCMELHDGAAPVEGNADRAAKKASMVATYSLDLEANPSSAEAGRHGRMQADFSEAKVVKHRML